MSVRLSVCHIRNVGQLSAVRNTVTLPHSAQRDQVSCITCIMVAYAAVLREHNCQIRTVYYSELTSVKAVDLISSGLFQPIIYSSEQNSRFSIDHQFVHDRKKNSHQIRSSPAALYKQPKMLANLEFII